MSKIANYLRSHIAGSVSTRADWRASVSADAGILAATPELVVAPRVVSDIRKITRFAWQMAEKGHTIPVVTRGAGCGALGGAVGQGILLDTTALNTIFEYDGKSQRVRVQPGVSARSVAAALSMHGAGVGPLTGQRGTVGGVIAAGARGTLLSRATDPAEAIDQIEVVLANGDVMQTERLSRRELSRRKGLPGFEGDIYRGVDAIITDNAALIEQINPNDTSGYSGIARVKQPDGTFDLGPLFVGSEGTLGIIDELILKTEFFSFRQTMAALVFCSSSEAQAAIDDIDALQPAQLSYLDAAIFEQLRRDGKKYAFYETAAQQFAPQAVLLVTLDDFNTRTRARKQAKLEQLQSVGETVVTIAEDDGDEDVAAGFAALDQYRWPDAAHVGVPRLFEGFYVPPQRFEEFTRALKPLARALQLPLPLAGYPSLNLYGVYPRLSLRKVSDKQKIFKLYDELTKLLALYDGHLVMSGGEGRLKTRFVRATQNPDLTALYQQIKQLFDPHGILNPGTKTTLQARTITAMLRNEYTVDWR